MLPELLGRERCCLILLGFKRSDSRLLFRFDWRLVRVAFWLEADDVWAQQVPKKTRTQLSERESNCLNQKTTI